VHIAAPSWLLLVIFIFWFYDIESRLACTGISLLALVMELSFRVLLSMSVEAFLKFIDTELEPIDYYLSRLFFVSLFYLIGLGG
jgi:hypothetical protein